MSQYLGLILLLLGMGSFFVLWLMKINNRSRVVETHVSEPEPIKPIERFASTSAYSLSPTHHSIAPKAPQEPSKAKTPAQPAGPVKADENAVQSSSEAPVEAEADDITAATHLEIAAQFFAMGDFEGTVDMCQLVSDNAAASTAQKESALELKNRCG